MHLDDQSPLQQIEAGILTMLEAIITANRDTLEGFEAREKNRYEQARLGLLMLESDADDLDEAILNSFSWAGAGSEDRQKLVSYLKIVNELVRMGVGTRKYSRRIETYCFDARVPMPFAAVVVSLHKSALRALELIRDCLTTLPLCDVEEVYRSVMVEESKNDDLYGVVEQEIMTSIVKATERSVDYIKVLSTLRRLERICDRAVTIADLLMCTKTGNKLSAYSGH